MSATDTDTKPRSGTYNGSCHCGKVKFTMKLSPPVEDGPVTSCNCSICSRQGLLLVYPLDSNLQWHSGLDDMTPYVFGKEKIRHYFCPTCGVSVRAKSTDPNVFADNTAINVRLLENLDLDALNLRKVDGKKI